MSEEIKEKLIDDDDFESVEYHSLADKISPDGPLEKSKLGEPHAVADLDHLLARIVKLDQEIKNRAADTLNIPKPLEFDLTQFESKLTRLASSNEVKKGSEAVKRDLVDLLETFQTLLARYGVLKK